jgi:hypothetical protein
MLYNVRYDEATYQAAPEQLQAAQLQQAQEHWQPPPDPTVQKLDMGDCEAPSDHQVASDCEDRNEDADADTGGTENEQVHVQLLLSQQGFCGLGGALSGSYPDSEI